MSVLGYHARNHPQQTARRGAREDVDDRGTSPELFDPLHSRFRFTIDVAAADHNAKLERYYTREQNGLAQSWARERVWCNPPYSDIRSWLWKAWDSWEYGIAPELIVMLLPNNRCEQSWWQDLVEPRRRRRDFEVEFLPGRPRFILHNRGHDAVQPNQRPPFGLCLLIWGDRNP